MRIDLASPIDSGGFRAEANRLLGQQVPPTDIAWEAVLSPDLGVRYRGDGAGPSTPSAVNAIVPRSFVRLTELVTLHRDGRRFDLLYRLLWRLVHEPELAGAHDDGDMAQARAMAQSVRRDVQRACKAARLRPLAPQADVALALAWCVPQHHVTEQVAAWLAGQHPAPLWLLASPDRCVLWTGRHLLCAPGIAARAADAMEDAQWHAVAAQLAAAVPPA